MSMPKYYITFKLFGHCNTLHYITLHTLLTFPTGFFNDNLHQIKLFKTNVSNNLKVIYKLDRREKLYVLFTVVIYKVSNIVFLLRILI